MQGVLFGDAVALVIGWLNPRLIAAGHAARATGDIPNPRPATFVTVERTGGPRRSLVVDEPQITIDAWAGLSQDAHDLAQLCRAYFHQMRGEVVGGIQVYDTDEFSGPGDLPDPVSTQARYTLNLTMALRYVSVVLA